MFELYVFSDGQTAVKILNAVAAFVSGKSFAEAISIAMTFSIVFAVFQYISTHDLTVMAKWFGAYFAVTVIMLGATTSVKVIDVTNPMAAGTIVDNVPYGIAVPASVISNLSYALSQGIADVFHTVDDADYNKTGLLFGAKVFHTVLQSATVVPSETRAAMGNFVSECIIPDIKINHKYTFDELAHSANIFTFLSSHRMSPLRGIFYQGQFMTCAAALPKIEASVAKQTPEQFALFGHLLGLNPKQPQFNPQTLIQDSQQYLMGLSISAKDTLLQNVAINALREGIGTSFAKGDASAALINYASTTAMQKQLLADFTEGHQGAYMMPLIQTTLFILLLGLFPVVALIALTPLFFKHMVKTYLLSLIYLGIWPTCFTVINFMVQARLSANLTGLASAHKGITLSNQHALLYMMEQSAGYASTLITMVPIISGGLLFGLHRMFMQSATVMLGSMQRSVVGEADQDAKGDIALANTSIGNHSWNNVSANKWDTNTTHFAGSRSTQLADGAVSTITPDGHHVVNATSGMSQLPVGLNFAKSLAASFQASSDHAHQAAVHAQDSYNTALSNAASTIVSYSDTTTNSQSYGTGESIGHTNSYDQAMSKMHSLAHDAAQSLGVSDEQAARAITQIATSQKGSMSFKSDKSFVGKVAAWASGISGSVEASISGSQESNSAHAHTINQGATTNSRASRLEEFRSAMHEVQNYASNQHVEQGASKADALAHQFSSNLSQATTASHTMSTDQSESSRMSELASRAQQESVGLNENLSQGFANYVQARASSESEANSILSNANDAATTQLRNEMAQAYLHDHQQQAEQWLSSQQSTSVNDIAQRGQSIVQSQASVQSLNVESNDVVAHKGAATAFNQNQLEWVSDRVEQQHIDGNQLIKNHDANLQIREDSLTDKNQAKLEQGAKDAETGALHQVERYKIGKMFLGDKDNNDIKASGDNE